MDVAKRLCGPRAVAAETVYTVPALTTTIVRNIHVANTTAAAVSFTLGVGGVTAALSLYYAFPVPPAGTLDFSGFIVLAAGETLQTAIGTGLTLAVSGVESS